MPKKNDKRGCESSNLNTYLIIILTSIIVILLAVLSAYLINPGDNIENKVLEKEELIKKEDVKRLRFWSVVLVVWNEAGNINMT